MPQTDKHRMQIWSLRSSFSMETMRHSRSVRTTSRVHIVRTSRSLLRVLHVSTNPRKTGCSRSQKSVVVAKEQLVSGNIYRVSGKDQHLYFVGQASTEQIGGSQAKPRGQWPHVLQTVTTLATCYLTGVAMARLSSQTNNRRAWQLQTLGSGIGQLLSTRQVRRPENATKVT
jgi:hypothetical protein